MKFNRQILISGLLLWLFAVLGTGFVAFTEESTRSQIAENERQALLRNLYALLPAEDLDNDIATDTLLVGPSALLGTETESVVYRARLDQRPVAAIFNSIANDGYSGKIHLLVGIYYDGRVAGVRAVKHTETPGLGDAIELKKTSWILNFDSKSLANPARDKWLVKRDGGAFDQFTGATITPRAIVKAVKNSLLYYQKNTDQIFQ